MSVSKKKDQYPNYFLRLFCFRIPRLVCSRGMSTVKLSLSLLCFSTGNAIILNCGNRPWNSFGLKKMKIKQTRQNSYLNSFGL